jgi:DNA replication protein DnaC
MRLTSTTDVEFLIASKDEPDEALEARLELCRERDALAATRPEGCECLGLGTFTEPRPAGLIMSIYCECPDGVAAQSARRAANHRLAMERKAATWEATEIPGRFKSWRFGTAPKSMAALADRLEMETTEEWWQDHGELDPSFKMSSWFLYGPYGRGKTGLAVSFAHAALMSSTVLDLAFVSAPDMFSRLRGTYNRNDGESEWDVVQEYATAGLLILDDLGAEAISATGRDWLEDRLYQIIGKRHSESLLTVFTSNLSIKELAPRIGERVTWRIVEMCGDDHIVKVDGPNLRST